MLGNKPGWLRELGRVLHMAKMPSKLAQIDQENGTKEHGNKRLPSIECDAGEQRVYVDAGDLKERKEYRRKENVDYPTPARRNHSLLQGPPSNL
jgi:hypothetical protein